MNEQKFKMFYFLQLEFLIILILIFDVSQAEDVFNHQARIISVGGHLIIQAAEHRNITFKSMGKGTVRVNDDDLLSIAEKMKETAIELNNLKQGDLLAVQMKLDEIIDQISDLKSYDERFFRLESEINNIRNQVWNATQKIRKVNRRYWRLRVPFRKYKNKVDEIETLLKTDDCASDPCQHGGTCEDGYDSYVCRCPPNWQGKRCDVDVNECSLYGSTTRGCQNGATCENTLGSFVCHCTANWYGPLCSSDHDDCTGASHEALCGHGTCVNLERVEAGRAKYKCICDAGYKVSNSGPSCVDEDECTRSPSPCPSNSICHNLEGSFACILHCQPGYVSNGQMCEDVNECLVNNGGCMSAVTCINTPGSRTCGPCPDGYQGNGVTCTYVGACLNNGGCYPSATCTQIPGGRQCTCPAGYFGSGVGPFGCTLQPGLTTDSTGVQPATCENNPCVHGVCINQGTSYHCACQYGYTGVNCDLQINECLSNPCQNGGTCTDQWFAFTCACPDGYSGTFCELQQQDCGDNFFALEGTLKYPVHEGEQYGHNLDCKWTIQTDPDKVLNLTFIKFHFENALNCAADYLQIDEHFETMTKTFGQFCGDQLPKGGTIITDHNKVTILLHTDFSESGDGFTLHWNSTAPECGGSLSKAFDSFKSPGYPNKYPHDRDCIWTIAVTLGKRIQFQFGTIKLEHHDDCEYDFLQIRDGFENDAVLKTFCSTTEPQPLTTSGSYAYVHFHSDFSNSDFGFDIRYSEVEGTVGCGGVLTSPEDVIAPPVHPDTQSYAGNLLCDWQIRVQEGERIKLTFTYMDLENETSFQECYFDYVEVFDGPDINARSLTKHCGTIIPQPIVSTNNYLTLRFRSDHSDHFTGFRAKYEIICGGVFSGTSGTIHSPLYPNSYPKERECVYIIQTESDRKIVLEFQDFQVESPYEDAVDCYYDFLEIRDGDDESHPQLAKLCGEKIPGNVMSSNNFMWIKFKTDDSMQHRGFLANYRTESTGGCGGFFMNELSGTFSSPGHPLPYSEDKLCRWIIKVPKHYAIHLTFDSFNLEESGCYYDYVEIFDNITSSNGTGHFLGKFCGTRIPDGLTTLGNVMTIIFKSDSEDNFEGFSASFEAINTSSLCRAKYNQPFGVIKSPNYPNEYPNDYDCVWTIQVPNGQQIELNITNLDIEANYVDNSCTFDYLEIRNGLEDTSPLEGQYCSINNPNIIKSHTHELYLHFHSDDSVQRNGFELIWDGTSTGCGGTINSVSGSVTSPGYPRHYYQSAFCEWRIAVNEGSRIKIFFDDLDMVTSCNWGYLDLHDGNLGPSSLIKRYCTNEIPEEPVLTSTNTLIVLYKTYVNEIGRGFSLRFISDCHNEINHGRRGIIESANFPSPYPKDQNCTWIINAPWGNKIRIIFSHMDLESWEDCRYDFVEIKENADPFKRLAKYCNETAPPDPITSESEGLIINFQTDGSQQMNGFRLEWMIIGCGGEYSKNEGSFSSPTEQLPRIKCEWYITVDYGLRVQLDIEKFDLDFSSNCEKDAFEVFGSFDPNATAITKLCHRTNSAQTVSSSGNRMLVRYSRNVAAVGSGFSAKWTGVEGGCGGEYTIPSATITSPNYPNQYNVRDDCTWLITVATSHTVLLNFTDFELESQYNCYKDYVKVYDGDNEDSNVLFEECSTSLPLTHIVRSSSNKLLIRFKSDSNENKRGFSATYTTDCGGTLNANDGGFISLSETSNMYSPFSNCSWKIIAENPGDRVTLTITHLHIYNYQSENDCSEVNLRVYEGEDTKSTPIKSLCDLEVPPPITSEGNALLVVLLRGPIGHAETISFTASYFESSSSCGANYTSDTGSFSSPGYPNTYPKGIDCFWTITAPPGNRVQLTFIDMDIEKSDEFCQTDYVQIHETNAAGKLIGVYCGTDIPFNVTSVQIFWIKFHSSEDTDSGRGFMIQYKMLYGNEIYGTEGEIATPLYPGYSTVSGTYKWHVVVPESMRIQVTFDNFIYRPSNKYVTLYDGPDENSIKIASYRGSNAEPVYTHSNELFVVFPSVSFTRSRFLLKWKAIYELPPGTISTWSWIPWTTPSPGCGSHVLIPENNVTNITSPGFPEGYANNIHCRWILETAAGNQLSLKIIILDLEDYSYYYCYGDSITIWDAFQGMENWQNERRFCSRADEGTFYNSTSHRLKLEFNTNYWRNNTGFLVQVQTECGGYLYESSGVIVSPKYPNSYPKMKSCIWLVTLKPGRTINVQFDSIDIESTTGCTDDYVLLRNGKGNDSPLLGEGKYCGNQNPITLTTITNYIYIKFVSDNKGNDNKGFKLRYEEVSLGCNENIILSNQIPSKHFRTPNFPSPPPPHSECDWKIMAPSGHRVELNFNSVFKIANESNCLTESVSVYDGGTIYSLLLLKHCGDHAPSTIWSTGTTMLVKFITDTETEGAGFQAEAKISICGGTYVKDKGIISSPNYPHAYGNNLNCEWFIRGPTGHYLTFTLTDFDLPDARNCTTVDHLQIRDYNSTGEILGTYCHSNIYGVWNNLVTDTSDSFGYVNFKSFQNTGNYNGFQLTFNSSVDECGGLKTTDSGVIASPNFPNFYPHHRRCGWIIKVPPGRRITLKITDMDLEEKNYYHVSTDTWWCNDRIVIYDSTSWHKALLAYNLCGTTIPPPIESSENSMEIFFFTDGDNTGTGFRAEYTSSSPAICGGDLTNFPGNLSSLTGEAYANRSLHCTWQISLDPSSSSIIFNFHDFNMTSGHDETTGCYTDSVKLLKGSSLDDSLFIYQRCGQLNNQKIFAVPAGNLFLLYIRSTFSNPNYGFNLTYNISQCGGELSGEDINLQSPNYPNNYGKDIHCAWQITVEEGEQIKLNFEEFDLDSDSDDYLIIYNGKTPFQTAVIGNFTNNKKPLSTIHSMNNALWIEFHSNNVAGSGKGFKATGFAQSEGCGGLFHGDRGPITSWNYPMQYPNDITCYWEIIVTPGFHLNLTFVESFDIQSSDSCSKDYLNVYEKKENDWRQIGTNLCGKELPSVLKSTVNHVNITFHSDESITGNGFKVMWQKSCGEIFREPYGTIYSPGFPNKYDNNLQCDYLIETDSQHYVRITFEPDFDIENTTDCNWDSIEIFKGNKSDPRNSLGKYCNKDAPGPFVSKGAIFIRFVSDFSVGRDGFIIRYTIQECGGNVTNSSGVIRSPSHPERYLANTDCYWTLIGTEGLSLQLVFTDLRLEYHYQCIYDYVAVYDGDSDKSVQIGRYCGNGYYGYYRQYEAITSSSNIMTVHFHSDDYGEYGGFVAVFKSIYTEQHGCGGLKNTSTGSIFSVKPAGSQEYAPDLDCEWTIILPENDKKVKLTFESFNVEKDSEDGCSWDYLEIRDGNSIYAPLRKRLCGSSKPSDIISTDNSLWIKFVTDSFKGETGFTATYTSITPDCGGNLEVANVTKEIKSPDFPSNYPINKRCVWNLMSEGGLGIDIKFDEFELEESPSCTKDYFNIKSAHTTPYWVYDDRQGKYCGAKLPHHFHTTLNSMQLTFESDNSITKKGFKLKYQTGICNRTYDEDNGKIIGSFSYTTETSGCLINVTTEETKTISLYIKFIDISWAQNCTKYGLKLYDDTLAESSLIQTYCRYQYGQSFVSTRNKFFLYYYGNTPYESKFEISYATTNKGRGCGGTLSGLGGDFSSPFYPSNYSVDSTCEWLLQVPPTGTIKLSFGYIEIGGSTNTLECDSNYVVVFDGPEDNNNAKLSRVCGWNWIPSIYSTKNEMLIKYVTTVNNTGQGFFANFAFIPWTESSPKILPRS